jgi:cytochrome P450
LKVAGSAVVLGGLASWRWFGRFLWDPLTCIGEVQQRFGPMVVLGNPVSARQRLVMAIGERYNREVLGQPDVFRTGGQVMPGPRGSTHRRMRLGILAMNGEQHLGARRMMQGPFQKPAVSAAVGTMAQLTDQMLAGWLPGGAIDLYAEMRKLSNWLAANILFGNEDFAASLRLGETIHRWFTCDARARKTFFWLNVPGTAYSQTLRLAEQLESDLKETIARNRRTRTPGSDVLSILIRALDSQQGSMTEAELIAHAVILYGASFETTANALAWTLFLVAQHPAIAADLHDEISARLASWPASREQLDELPLLDGVVRESLRLLPPVAYSFRMPVCDADLAGLAVRKGDRVLLSHFHTHRNPAVFPDALRFRPSRWFDFRPSPYEYMPFSAGSRLCLGYSFALAELKLVVARVMQHFRLQAVAGSRVDAVVRLTLQPQQGLPMRVFAQDRAFEAAPITGNIRTMVDLGD